MSNFQSEIAVLNLTHDINSLLAFLNRANEMNTSTQPDPPPHKYPSILTKSDARHLLSLGLLLLPPGSHTSLGLMNPSPDNMLRTSRDIMLSNTYPESEDPPSFYRRRGPTTFESWSGMPNELQMTVMDYLPDQALISLSHTSKATRGLFSTAVKRRRAEFACIPAEEVSLAMLRYIGFTDQKAGEMWGVWVGMRRRRRGDGEGFLDFALCAGCGGLSGEESMDGDAAPENDSEEAMDIDVDNETDDGNDNNGNTNNDFANQQLNDVDAWDEKDDWRAVMTNWGLSKEFQDSILDPEFDDIRLTESCKYWVQTTIELRYDTLLGIRHASFHRAHSLAPVAPVPKINGCSNRTFPIQDPLQNHRPTQPRSNKKEEVEMTVLYKSIGVALAHCILPPPGFEKCRHNAPFMILQDASWPADFSCWDGSVTMYPSRLLAGKFAKYSERRSRGLSPAVLVKMSIPTRALRKKLEIKSFGKEDEEEWKKMVWMNRVGYDPAVAGSLDGLDLVVGRVSCNKGKALEKMASWEEMSEDNLLMADEGRGLQPTVQYSFLGDDWVASLREQVQLEMVVL